MRMTGEQKIAAPRQKVWEALNDPAILRQCIPGCESLEREGENRLNAVAEIRIGPIGARFRGAVELSELDPPNGCRISGQGSGGIAGSAKGGAKVRLADDAGGTVISYEVEAEVGGRMAQLGGPIIDATAKQLAGKFFAKFGEVVAGGASAEAPAVAGAAPPVVVAAAAHAGQPVAGGRPAPLWGWVTALVLALLAGFALGLRGAGTDVVEVLALLVVTAAAAYQAGRAGGGR